MYNLLTEMYYGELRPFAMKQSRSDSCQNAILRSDELHKKAVQTFSKEQMELLEQICAERNTAAAEDEKTAFIGGFRLGMRLAAEIYADDA